MIGVSEEVEDPNVEEFHFDTFLDQILVASMSILPPSFLLAELRVNCSPDSGWSRGSIETSKKTLLNKAAV